MNHNQELVRSRDAFVQDVARSDMSTCYRDFWQGAETYEALPKSTRKLFEQIPLSKRTYSTERMFVKVAHGKSGIFAVGQAFSDIEKEHYGYVTQRPVVFMRDAHDALEKGVWCYAQGMVPLVSEYDATVGGVMVRKYHADQIITDTASLQLLTSFFAEEEHTVTHVTIIDHVFDIKALVPLHARGMSIRLVLGLTETGMLAEATYAGDVPVFTPCSSCVIDTGPETLVTKMRMTVTPIIKYHVPLRTQAVDDKGSFLIDAHQGV